MKRHLIICCMLCSLLAIACGKGGSVTPEDTKTTDGGNTNNGGSTNTGGNTSPALAITDFSPQSASQGNTVTITGTAFGTDTNAVTIKFGTSAVRKPRTISATQMTVIVPSDAQTGKITVTINGKSVATATDFTFVKSNNGTGTSLSISDFNPKSAKPVSKITITGTGFGSNPSAVKLLIGNGPYYDLISVSPTTIVIQTNLATTSGKISVFINGQQTTSTGDFVALPQDLKIINFTGSAGQDGSSQLGHQMFINTNGLYESGGVPMIMKDTDKVFITFAGTGPIKANYIGPSSISTGTVVPRNAQAGKVTLTVNGHSLTSSDNFNLDMSMRDFSPKTFSYGDTVKITGVGFTTDSDMGVHFRAGSCCEVFARPISVTSTQMFVIVPYNTSITSGYLEISANAGVNTDISPYTYTFKP